LNHALAEALGWNLVDDITVPGESRSYYRLQDAMANVEAYRQLSEWAKSGNVSWVIV
jgi:hypothetical protein